MSEHVDLSSVPLQYRVAAGPWPCGQLTRPWKWFTRQMRLEHWNERDSMFSSWTLKPGKSTRYSSSGVHGSPMPPELHATGSVASETTLAMASRPKTMERVIRTCSFGGISRGV